MLTAVKKNIGNVLGWKTNRKILVFESDDWGSIRMPSKETYESMLRSGVRVDKCRYNKYDALESNADVEMLLEVLSRYKDSNGNPPIFTAFAIMANPDFEKIKESDFQQYFYEPFTETLQRYNNRDRILALFKEAIVNKLFHVEFHGREHLNVNRWMADLRSNVTTTRIGFEHKLTGISTNIADDITKIYQAAFDVDRVHELKQHKKILEDGLNLFEKIYGYRARFFVPPNYIFNNSLDETLAKLGVQFITTGKKAIQPLGGGKRKISYRYSGKRNNFGQIYMTRNALFETNSSDSIDWVNNCLRDIKNAFRWNKPAVISTHRINFSGSINPKNRSNGLIQLNKLLQEILLHWSDVEFMSSTALGNLMLEE